LDIIGDFSQLARTIWATMLSLPPWVWTVAEGGVGGTAVSAAIRQYEKREAKRLKLLQDCRAMLLPLLAKSAASNERISYMGYVAEGRPKHRMLWPSGLLAPDPSGVPVALRLFERARSHLSAREYGNATAYLLRAEASLDADNARIYELTKVLDSRLDSLCPEEWRQVHASGDPPNYNPARCKSLIFAKLASDRPELATPVIRHPNPGPLQAQLWFSVGSEAGGEFLAQGDAPSVEKLWAYVKTALVDPLVIKTVEEVGDLRNRATTDTEVTRFDGLRTEAYSSVALGVAGKPPIAGSCEGCRPRSRFFGGFLRWRKASA
jgi:hypothetical protein